MRPGPGVDDHRLHAIAMGAVDALGHFTLVIGLVALDLRAQFKAQGGQLGVDFVQRGRAILGRVTFAEHVQVDAVQDKDVHGGGSIAQRIVGIGSKICDCR